MARSSKTETLDERQNRILAESYGKGESIRQLAAATGLSYSAARARLIAAGVSLRPMGRTRGVPQRHRYDGTQN